MSAFNRTPIDVYNHGSGWSFYALFSVVVIKFERDD